MRVAMAYMMVAVLKASQTSVGKIRMVAVSALSQILVAMIETKGGFSAIASAQKASQTQPGLLIVIKIVPATFEMMACFVDSLNMDAEMVMNGSVRTDYLMQEFSSAVKLRMVLLTPTFRAGALYITVKIYDR
jgi:hypothetical protein